MCKRCPEQMLILGGKRVCNCPCSNEYVKDGKCNICGHKLNFYK